MFPPSHWKHVFFLLGLVVVANGRVLKEEVDGFLDEVARLHACIDPTVALTRHMALDWFRLNRRALDATIQGLAHDTAIIGTLAPIRSLARKREVVASMVRVGSVNGRCQGLELGLVRKTARYWNLPQAALQDILQNAGVTGAPSRRSATPSGATPGRATPGRATWRPVC